MSKRDQLPSRNRCNAASISASLAPQSQLRSSTNRDETEDGCGVISEVGLVVTTGLASRVLTVGHLDVESQGFECEDGSLLNVDQGGVA